MTAKKLLFRSEARERILAGATTLTDAVRVTLGPKSKSVLIQKRYGSPIVCNDGVTIARELELEDPVENLGAEMLREAAQRTGDAVGDGTSAEHNPRARDLRVGGCATWSPARAPITLKRGSNRRGAGRGRDAARAIAPRDDEAGQVRPVATISAHNVAGNRGDGRRCARARSATRA
jgi:chaperonin GroEL